MLGEARSKVDGVGVDSAGHTPGQRAGLDREKDGGVR